MNILIFSWRGPGHPHAGGAEIVTHEYAKGWVKAGHTVTLFTSSYNNAKKYDVIDGVNITRMGDQAIGVKIYAFIWYLFGKHLEFDLVIDQFHGIPFFTPLYVHVRKLAFIHEVTKDVWKYNPWIWPFNLLPRILGPFLEPFIFKVIYRKIPFLTVSKSTEDDLIAFGIKRNQISIIHNGVIIPQKKYAFKKELTKTVIFLGALAKDKGIETALRIFAKVSKLTKQNVHFWLLGKGDMQYTHFLKKMAKEYGIEESTTFLGYVSEEKKFELLSRGHILVSPSVREGWGLVVIEAAAMGTPTVAFRVPGLRDSIVNGKTGILCDDENEMAHVVVHLLKDSNTYKTYSREAISWSKKFKWENSIKQSLRLLDSVVS